MLTAIEKATNNTQSVMNQADLETIENALFLLNGVKTQLDAYAELTHANVGDSRVAMLENIKINIDHIQEMITSCTLEKESIVKQ